jgi:hypothetical protein
MPLFLEKNCFGGYKSDVKDLVFSWLKELVYDVTNAHALKCVGR